MAKNDDNTQVEPTIEELQQQLEDMKEAKEIAETQAQNAKDAQAAAEAKVTEFETKAKEIVDTPEVSLDEASILNGITYDGTEKKQGEKVVAKAFGVTIVTNY